MITQPNSDEIRTLSIRKEVDIDAPIDITFASVLDELGPGSELPDGTPFGFKFEAWPGGRWYRDLGNNSGHFWGHVQVIKPPTLLEICGPMFMSYPAMNFVQYRLSAVGDRTLLAVTHRAMGLITQEHREGAEMGWDHGLRRIAEIARQKLTMKTNDGTPRHSSHR
jgi:uncharacterized protein YndB with AHSA1/START domain